MAVPLIDVALSYASEQEGYVQSVALALRQRGVNVFYAPFQKTDLWGEDLIHYLERVYRDWAKLCVMFISQEYVVKAWPSHERRSALARQISTNSIYILPVRFDDTPVPGLPTSLSYVNASDHDGDELAQMIAVKLSLLIT